MKSLVSIITPMFNSEAFIEETINSILNQTYIHWELILIDDKSTDQTLKVVQRFLSQHSNIKLLINNTNCGAAISRNKGLLEAKGEFIAFLDADDLWKTNKLEKQITFMKAEKCEICYSSYEHIDEFGMPLKRLVKALPLLTYKKYLKSNYIGNLTGIYNAKILGKIESPNLRKRQDWLLWLKAIKQSGKPAKGIQESLAYYRVRPNSISANKFNLIKYNYLVYKRGLGFSTIKSIYSMLVFLKEHFFVKSKQTVGLE